MRQKFSYLAAAYAAALCVRAGWPEVVVADGKGDGKWDGEWDGKSHGGSHGKATVTGMAPGHLLDLLDAYVGNLKGVGVGFTLAGLVPGHSAAPRGDTKKKAGATELVKETVKVDGSERQHWKEETNVNRGQATLSGLDTYDGSVQVRSVAQVECRSGKVGRSGRVSEGVSPCDVARGGQWRDTSHRPQGGTHDEEIVARAGGSRC